MFEKIVWATDGSELANSALPVVKRLARDFSSAIDVVHVNVLLTGRFGGAPVLADEPDVQPQLKQQVERLREEGYAATLRIVTTSADTPAKAIADAARRADADLIVVATHAHGAVGTFFFGSVAKGLVHEASCPVLSVPPGVTSKVHEPVQVHA